MSEETGPELLQKRICFAGLTRDEQRAYNEELEEINGIREMITQELNVLPTNKQKIKTIRLPIGARRD